MLPIKTERDLFMMTHMINKDDYDFLKQKSNEIITNLEEFNKSSINQAIFKAKQYLDEVLPSFFEVFMNQTNYGTIITYKEGLEKWKKLDWNVPMDFKITQSFFYSILLNNKRFWNDDKDYLFDNFIEFFHLKNSIEPAYLIYSYGSFEENGKKALMILDRSYLLGLIRYFKTLASTKDFKEYQSISFNLLDGMWHFITDYYDIHRTDIDKDMYKNEWEKYYNNPKAYLIDYLKNHKSKWKIEDLK